MVDDVRTLIARGIGWKFGSQVVQQSVRLASGILIARLMTPHEVGLAAMVFVFASVGVVVNDLALGSALIQKREITSVDISTVFWTTVGTGALLAVGGYFASAPIADLYGEPDVKVLFEVICITLLLGGLSSTQASLMTRAMDFKKLELRQVVASFLGATVAIVCAWRGLGAWALIAQALAISASTVVMLWTLSDWRPEFRFSVASLRELGGFGGKLFASKILTWTNTNIDNLLVGRFLGSAALGAYSIGFNTMLSPLMRVALPVQQVLSPAYAMLQADRRAIAQSWVRASRVLGALLIPALVGLSVTASALVPAVFGSKWSAAVPVLQALGLAGAAQVYTSLSPSVLAACNRPGVQLHLSAATLVASVAGVVAGLNWGVALVATFFAAAQAVMLPITILVTCRVVGAKPRDFVGAVRGTVEASAAMGAALTAAEIFLSSAGLADGIRLTLLVVAGVALYIPLLAWRDPTTFAEARELLRTRGKRTAQASRALRRPQGATLDTSVSWNRMQELVDGAPGQAALITHRLQLIAVRLWREQGRQIPQSLLTGEANARTLATMLPFVLENVRAAYPGRMAIMKGAEVAAAYPCRTDRPWGDLDLLVDDVVEAQQALVAAGFIEVGEPELYRDIHHLRPLLLPMVPIPIELHHEPKWPTDLGPTPTAEYLLDAAVPSRVMEGMLALHPAHHAVCLATHAWAHEPLARVGDLLDVSLAADVASRREVQASARDLGVSRLWQTTLEAADAILATGRRHTPTRIWARHLMTARERSVFEGHMMRWFSPLADRFFIRGTWAFVRAVVDDLRPARGERWRAKWSRARIAMRNAALPRAAHHSEIGEAAHAGNRVRERIAARRNA